ncbi:nuclease SbcCD subunit C [Deinococcus piscis]|uniref:Nuclease SbcCD subunit C n=1 Tax=Deinococcus piscis TaxID=394230 RepID=A0ABQ3K0G3_9DEIO|nr:SMC family ATPase [Deinococcus piscis]GHF96285.1 nuclease SbcCD subunit C [Deinococcus piscis]
MRPLHLTLSGFTAFRQHTELDFEGLDLFAVVGPTGSGKSSLLDAITFALYGQTARLGATGLDALISQGERALSVSLTFELPAETGPQVYRVARSKGRKTAENETRLEHRQPDGRWKDLAPGAGQRVVSARIQELLGLDFRTFARSVLLPQGEFARLLHGTGKERQDLLGELMGLDSVRAMHRYAGEQAKALSFELSSLHALLENEYAGVSPASVRELRGARATLAEKLDTWQDEREEVMAGLTRWQNIAGLWQSREDLQRRLSVQQGRQAEVERGSERAAQARRVAGILPLIDREGRARIALEREESEWQGAQAQAQQAEQAAAQAQAAQQQAQAAEAQIPELEARAEALRDAEALAARLHRAGGTPEHRHPQPLPWDEDAHAAAKADADRLDKLRLESVQLKAEQVSWQADQERQKAELALLERRTAELERSKEEGLERADTLKSAKARLEQLRTEAGLAAYHAALKEGEPCPLCGSTVHALPPSPEHLSRQLDEQARQVQALENDLVERRGEFAALKEEIKSLTAQTEKRRSDLTDWEAQLKQREQDNRAATERIAGNPAEQVARLLAGLAEQVRSFGPHPAAERQKAQAHITDIRRSLTATTQALAEASSAAAAAQATLRSAEANAAARRAEAQEAAQELSSALQASGLSSEAAKAAALPESEITALEQAAQSWQAGLDTLSAQEAALSEQLSAALAGAEYDPQALPGLSARLHTLDAQIAAGRSEAGRLEAHEKSAAERLARKEEIEAQTVGLSERMDTWKTLANSLKANEFQQFLLAEVEANLLTGAGHILHDISDGRYRLTLDGGDYAVQDLWNGGETRGVKTLSGGETFLASLSLAIALSDYLAGNRILGALFLDEGFGTLDPQALEAVAGALENLRTQGRMVGVVTHVESLSERLPTQLLVSKSIAGSTVMRLES